MTHKDEILVSKKYISNKADPLYIVRSWHSDHLNLLTKKKSLDGVDIQSLNSLGFAFALNELDKYGNKVYIKHNFRTKMENKKTK